PKSARPRFIARPQDHFLAMHFAQTANPFFHRMQVIAERARVAHFTPASFLCRRRQDTVFVDIQSKIEFFFHLSVFVCSLLLILQRSGTLCPGRWCGSAPPQKDE